MTAPKNPPGQLEPVQSVGGHLTPLSERPLLSLTLSQTLDPEASNHVPIVTPYLPVSAIVPARP